MERKVVVLGGHHVFSQEILDRLRENGRHLDGVVLIKAPDPVDYNIDEDLKEHARMMKEKSKAPWKCSKEEAWSPGQHAPMKRGRKK